MRFFACKKYAYNIKLEQFRFIYRSNKYVEDEFFGAILRWLKCLAG